MYVAYQSDFYLEKINTLIEQISIKSFSNKEASREYNKINNEIMTFFENNNINLINFLQKEKWRNFQPKIRHTLQLLLLDVV